jgi:hypothetical protein
LRPAYSAWLFARTVWCAAPEIEAQVADYRADIIGVDGRIVRAIDLICPGDDVAKEHARSLVDSNDVELWYGSRMVAKFKAHAVKAPCKLRDRF